MLSLQCALSIPYMMCVLMMEILCMCCEFWSIFYLSNSVRPVLLYLSVLLRKGIAEYAPRVGLHSWH